MCGAFSGFLVPSLPTLCFPLCISVTGACFSRGHGGSWLGCQVLPAIGAVSILELAANSGSSRMSRAPNLQRATKLFIVFRRPYFIMIIILIIIIIITVLLSLLNKEGKHFQRKYCEFKNLPKSFSSDLGLHHQKQKQVLSCNTTTCTID